MGGMRDHLVVGVAHCVGPVGGAVPVANVRLVGGGGLDVAPAEATGHRARVASVNCGAKRIRAG